MPRRSPRFAKKEEAVPESDQTVAVENPMVQKQPQPQQPTPEVSAQIETMNQHINFLSTKLIELTAEVTEIKQKKQKRRSYCSVM